ncbi:MAG: trigger factor [Pseudomonadota bacterium]
MKLTIEDKSTVKKVLHIEIPKEDVVSELNKAYNELKKTATIKGFRKGKIPRKVLESRFGKDVHADVAPKLIQDAFSQAVLDHKLNLVGGPRLDPPDLNPEADYIFDITVEVRPEIEDFDIKGIELKKTLYEVTDNDIDSQIQMIRKTMSKKKSVEEERAVKADDFVLIDYQGFVDGKPFDGTPLIENYVMAVGGNTMPEAFWTKLIGVVPVKELEIEVAYGEDAPAENKDLAGKTVTYKVTLKEIQEEILPPVDDTLVENLGQYKDLEELKSAIRDNMSKGYAQRVQHEMSEQIFTTLLEKVQFEVPEAMIDAELEGIVAEAEQAYANNNISLEEMGLNKDFLKSQYREVAEKQARRHLLLGKIIEQEKLEMTDDELEASFKEIAGGMNASVDAIKNYFKMDERQLDYYKHSQLEKKAVRLIIESGSVTEVAPEENSEASGESIDGDVKDSPQE